MQTIPVLAVEPIPAVSIVALVLAGLLVLSGPVSWRRAPARRRRSDPRALEDDLDDYHRLAQQVVHRLHRLRSRTDLSPSAADEIRSIEGDIAQLGQALERSAGDAAELVRHLGDRPR
jgi:hypothetical protein